MMRSEVFSNTSSLPRLALLATLALASCADEPPDRPAPGNVLVLTVDTTRKDALGLYGRSPSPTPCLDRLAAESVVFDEAHTVVPLTLPAHSSMFTGLYPVSSGVRVNGITRVPAEARTLAEVLGEEGYSTGAAVAAYVLDPIFGLAQGFDAYDAPARTPGDSNLHTTQRRAGEMFRIALDQMQQMQPPFFYWLHLYDPHFPYDPEQPPPIPAGATPEEVERLLYQAEIVEVDRALEGFLEQLEHLGLDRDLTLVVASDHGESLGEHGEATHGHFVYDATMRVPLLLRHPGLAPARVAVPVSLVDVTPTLLSLLDISRPDLSFDGLDLTPWLGADPAESPDRSLALESYHLYVNSGWAPFEGVVRGPMKYIHSRRRELYDRAADPAEAVNLYAPDESRSRGFERQVESMFTNPPNALAADTVVMTQFDQQALAEIGYAGVPTRTDVSRPDFDSLPDATEHLDLIDRFERANLALALKKPRRAIRILRLLCQEDPGNAKFRSMLGSLLLVHEPDALDEAEEHLQEAARLQFSMTEAHYNLGLVWNRRSIKADRQARQEDQAGAAGEAVRHRETATELREKALAEFLITLDLEPIHPEALANAAMILRGKAAALERDGAADQAEALHQRALEFLDRFLEVVPESHPDWPRWNATREQWTGDR